MAQYKDFALIRGLAYILLISICASENHEIIGGSQMCFRPPNVKKPIKCPKCGALNPGTNKECSKCNADLTKEQESSASGKEV